MVFGPSDTEIVFGSNVIPVMIGILHELLTLIVIKEAVGEKDVVEP